MSSTPNFDNILNSLEGVRRAEPRPFFAARVIQRLQEKNQMTPSFYWPRFALAVSALFILIALNLILFLSPLRSIDQAISDWNSATPDWVVDYTENPGTTIYDLPPNK
jgi:hypothetical protein